MNVVDKLERIALADASCSEARSILQEALSSATPAVAQEIGVALRAWTWKALTGRRFDSELHEWHDTLRRVAVRMKSVDERQANRAELLSELVHESIVSARLFSADNVLQRAHTKKMLALLADSKDGRMDRERLGAKLGLQQANLTRVINLLIDSGLATRESEGRQVTLEITRSGRERVNNFAVAAVDQSKLFPVRTEYDKGQMVGQEPSDPDVQRYLLHFIEQVLGIEQFLGNFESVSEPSKDSKLHTSKKRRLKIHGFRGLKVKPPVLPIHQNVPIFTEAAQSEGLRVKTSREVHEGYVVVGLDTSKTRDVSEWARYEAAPIEPSIVTQKTSTLTRFASKA